MAVSPESWKVGDRIFHDGFGEGEITHRFGEGERVSISVRFGDSPKILDPTRAPIRPLLVQGQADPPQEDESIDLDLPVRVSRSQWRWRGAEFATSSEMLLAKALVDQGAMVASNANLILRESAKLHRKPDLLVFLPHEGRLLSGVAEVDGSAHDGRWLEDQQRDQELQRNGFLAVRHYSNEQVLADPAGVAGDFLGFLQQFHPLAQSQAPQEPALLF